MIASNEGKFVTNITDTCTHRHNMKNLCPEDPSAENTELFLVLSLKPLIAFVSRHFPLSRIGHDGLECSAFYQEFRLSIFCFSGSFNFITCLFLANSLRVSQQQIRLWTEDVMNYISPRFSTCDSKDLCFALIINNMTVAVD